MAKSEIKLESKCVSCRNTETMTDEQIARAQLMGCAFCSKCGSPATISKVTVQPVKRGKARQ